RKISEEQGALGGTVMRIRFSQGMGIDAKPLHEPIPTAIPIAQLPRREVEPLLGLLAQPWSNRRPEHGTTEGELEVADRRHGDGIDHLLVKLRIAFRWSESVLGERVRMI